MRVVWVWVVVAGIGEVDVGEVSVGVGVGTGVGVRGLVKGGVVGVNGTHMDADDVGKYSVGMCMGCMDGLGVRGVGERSRRRHVQHGHGYG